MKVAVAGAGGVMGRAVVPALLGSGHEVVALVRGGGARETMERLGADARVADLLDLDALTAAFRGCDAVVNLIARVPTGYRAVLPRAWRESDRLRTDGVRLLIEASRAAGSRRLVQHSVSLVYADQGSHWVDERSPLDITAATEPVSVGECAVQQFAGASRTSVVLRMGTVIGDSESTRRSLRAVALHRPIGMGSPDGWAHVMHSDDVGPAFLAALDAPSGVYNVGAEPVRRRDLFAGFADAVGADHAGFVGPWFTKVMGTRGEPLARSLRVDSTAFICGTGWSPRRDRFDASWLEAGLQTVG